MSTTSEVWFYPSVQRTNRHTVTRRPGALGDLTSRVDTRAC
jgi:hypothetical protein